MKEVGTLKELNVKPGDVVEMVSGLGSVGYGLILTIDKNGYARYTDNLSFNPAMDYAYGRAYKIISRASPKSWKDLSPKEKGALLLASHEGKAIQYFTTKGIWSACISPIWDDYCAYRIKPEPVVKTITQYWKTNKEGQFVPMHMTQKPTPEHLPTHKITFNVVDGEPDVSSVRMEKI